MPYRMNCLYVKNFKCFDNKNFYCFNFNEALNPIILSGPNGFGKTTFFDAVELIFTKSITRLHADIEDNRINLGKNILLNESGFDGVLVLNIKDENKNGLSIITRIDYKNEKLSIRDSITYKVSPKLLESEDEINMFLKTEDEWKTSLTDCVKLKYSIDHFNVYYYISQAESVHFLKKSIKDRKSSVNTLLNTDIVDTHIEYIEKNLIGGTRGKKGVIVNDELTASEERIKEYISLIKAKQKESPQVTYNVEYEQLLNYTGGMAPFPWDIETIVFSENSQNYLENMINDIERLHHYIINKEDYSLSIENEIIKKTIDNRCTDDFIKYYNFFEDNILNVEDIIEYNLSLQDKLELYNHSSFFRKNFDVSLFKKEDLIKLKETDATLLTCDIENISNIVKEVLDRKKTLSENQNLLIKLQEARQELHNHSRALGDSKHCPYCYHPFSEESKLESAFLELSTQLSERKSTDSERIEELIQELKEKLKSDQENILNKIQGLDENSIRDLNLTIIQNQQFIDDKRRINAVTKINQYLCNDDSWLLQEETQRPLAIERILQEKIKAYNNPEFLTILDKYNFRKIAESHNNILSLEQPRLMEKDAVVKKIAFLKQKYTQSKENELSILIDKLKDELINKQKLETLRKSLDKVNALYKSAIETYRNQIIKKLRIPLLIYSGKILQDYQNGLGIFISRDEMRFVANGDAKHDILNTFSSGQLSGFVLSFLFAMNKQYITKSNDDIGFILVDDPVQTMDDINIASLIEVLRNDFGGKQIILSTHETDKENYILYKFLKYNLKGQSFNVKERLYL